jgi:hypothetical protein
MYNVGHNKCKELLPKKLQFKVEKNPKWRGSWMLLDALFPVEKGMLARPWRMLWTPGFMDLLQCKFWLFGIVAVAIAMMTPELSMHATFALLHHHRPEPTCLQHEPLDFLWTDLYFFLAYFVVFPLLNNILVLASN